LSSRALVRWAALVAGTALAVPLWTGVATAAPFISVTPSSGLTDSQVVSVNGGGFDPNIGNLTLLECAAGPTTNCDFAHFTGAQLDPSGSFAPTSFTVRQTFDGSTGIGQPTTPVDCLAVNCILVAAVPSQAFATHNLSFGAGPAADPFEVTGTISNAAGVMPENTVGAIGCPGTTVQLGCGGVVPTSANAQGDYNLILDAGLSSTWTVSAISLGQGMLLGTAHQVTAPPTDDPVEQDLLVEAAIVGGRVTHGNGTTPYAIGSGVTACLPPACPTGVAKGADGNGDFLVALAAAPAPGSTSYDLAGFAGPGPGFVGGPATPVTVSDGDTLSNQNRIVQAQVVQGSVTDLDGNPLPSGGAGFCPVPGTGPGCPGLRFANTNPFGTYSLLLETGSYNAAGVATMPTLFLGPGRPVTVGDSESPSTENFLVYDNRGLVTGTVTAAGGAPFSGNAIVAACPAPGPIAVGCAGGLSIATATPGYTLGLAPNTYVVGAFRFDGPVSPSIPPDEASATVTLTIVDDLTHACDFAFGGAAPSCAPPEDDDGVDAATENSVGDGDGDNDGVPDSLQDWVTSLPAAEGGGGLTVAAPSTASLEDVVAIPTPSGAPDVFPAGLVGFTIRDIAAGSTVTVDVYFPTGTNPTSYWKYQNGIWTDFSAHTIIVGDKVTLNLTDNGDGDADPTPGVIVDPGGASGHFPFAGFFSPVDNLPTLNSVKAGKAVPVKFSLGGDRGLDIFAAGSPSSTAVTCGDLAVDALEVTVTAGSSDLAYDAATDTYTYVWKTNKNWTGCRQLVLVLTDGTEHRANFTFT
jgi:hypothetical protein